MFARVFADSKLLLNRDFLILVILHGIGYKNIQRKFEACHQLESGLAQKNSHSGILYRQRVYFYIVIRLYHFEALCQGNYLLFMFIHLTESFPRRKHFFDCERGRMGNWKIARRSRTLDPVICKS